MKEKTEIKWGNGEKLTISELENGNIKLEVESLGGTEIPAKLFIEGIKNFLN